MSVPSHVMKQLESLLSRKASVITHKRHSWKFEGKWLRAGHCHYIGGDGTERIWEMNERTTTKKGSVDGVDIIALNEGMLSLVAVYRPPVDKISIEFPAGLLNDGESPSLAAVRELKEETGQDGVCQSISPVVYTDPWKSNESSVVCHMTVTGRGHTLSLDEDEYLEHFELPLKGLMGSLRTLQEQFDIVIESRLYLFSLGLEMK